MKDKDIHLIELHTHELELVTDSLLSALNNLYCVLKTADDKDRDYINTRIQAMAGLYNYLEGGCINAYSNEVIGLSKTES